VSKSTVHVPFKNAAGAKRGKMQPVPSHFPALGTSVAKRKKICNRNWFQARKNARESSHGWS